MVPYNMVHTSDDYTNSGSIFESFINFSCFSSIVLTCLFFGSGSEKFLFEERLRKCFFVMQKTYSAKVIAMKATTKRKYDVEIGAFNPSDSDFTSFSF